MHPHASLWMDPETGRYFRHFQAFARAFAHVPEKWGPVFDKDTRQQRS
jgi:hypothetical protein